MLTPGAKHRKKLSTPEPLSGRAKTSPPPCPNHHTDRQESAAESAAKERTLSGRNRGGSAGADRVPYPRNGPPQTGIDCHGQHQLDPVHLGDRKPTHPKQLFHQHHGGQSPRLKHGDSKADERQGRIGFPVRRGPDRNRTHHLHHGKNCPHSAAHSTCPASWLMPTSPGSPSVRDTGAGFWKQGHWLGSDFGGAQG